MLPEHSWTSESVNNVFGVPVRCICTRTTTNNLVQGCTQPITLTQGTRAASPFLANTSMRRYFGLLGDNGLIPHSTTPPLDFREGHQTLRYMVHW